MLMRDETSIAVKNFIIIFLVIISIAFLLYIRDTAFEDVPVEESQGAMVLRDLAAGMPVSKIAFDRAFPQYASPYREASIRHAAEDLGLKPEDVWDMIKDAGLSVVYTGSPDNIPEKLRPATIQSDEEMVRQRGKEGSVIFMK